MRENLTPLQEARLQKALVANQKAKNFRVEEYSENPTLCTCCKKSLPYDKKRNKFCSHSCAGTFNNGLRDSSGNLQHGKYSLKPCLCCGEITDNLKYCSRECSIKHRKQVKLDEFVASGKVVGNPVTIKSYLLQLRDRKCELCGLEEWRGQPVPLVLDHVNGNPSDNCLDNLQLVCGNCNMQLPTFAGRNIGKGGGRPYRNKRYLEGKSW